MVYSNKAELSEEELERAELLEDIRIAREQVANGEGVPHDEALELLLAKY